MELDGGKITYGDGAAKWNSIVSLADDERFIIRLAIITMYKIKISVVRNPIEYPVGSLVFHLIPTDLRNLLSCRQLEDLSGYDVQAVIITFFGMSEQDLHPYAYPKKRLS